MKKIIKWTPKLNWSTIPVGTKFTASIQRVKCEGRIQKLSDTGRVYLCQNVKDGNSCGNNLEYDWSWTIGYGDNPRGYEVINLVLELDPKFNSKSIKSYSPMKMSLMGYSAQINGINAKIGCQTIPFGDIEEVYNAMCYKQLNPKQEVVIPKSIGCRNVTFSYDGKTVYFNGNPVKFNVVEKVYTHMCYRQFGL